MTVLGEMYERLSGEDHRKKLSEAMELVAFDIATSVSMLRRKTWVINNHPFEGVGALPTPRAAEPPTGARRPAGPVRAGPAGDNQNGVCAGGEAGWPWAQSSRHPGPIRHSRRCRIRRDLHGPAGTGRACPGGRPVRGRAGRGGHLIGLGGALRKGNQQAEIWERGRQFLFCGT